MGNELKIEKAACRTRLRQHSRKRHKYFFSTPKISALMYKHTSEARVSHFLKENISHKPKDLAAKWTKQGCLKTNLNDGCFLSSILPVALNLTFFALNDYLDQMNDLCRNET